MVMNFKEEVSCETFLITVLQIKVNEVQKYFALFIVKIQNAFHEFCYLRERIDI
jgi:hypothetical protein